MIYLSYNYIMEKEPSWLTLFVKFCVENKIPYCVANDFDSFFNKGSETVSELIASKVRMLEMDYNLLEPPSSENIKGHLAAFLKYGITEGTVDFLFFNLYMLLRSDIVVMNLNSRTEPHDLIVSNMLGIPSLCITDNYSLNPYAIKYSSAITKPTSTSDIYTLIEGLLNGKK